jgi:hypothetical protein
MCGIWAKNAHPGSLSAFPPRQCHHGAGDGLCVALSVRIDSCPPDSAYLMNRGRDLSGRAARGSVAPRKMACRAGSRGGHFKRFKAIDSRRGAAALLPLAH